MNQNFAQNIIYWIGWSDYYYSGGSIVTFEFSGLTAAVFDLQTVNGQISSIIGDCPIPAITTFDAANVELNVIYSYKAYTNYSECINSLSAYYLNYNPSSTGDSFSIRLDAQSLMIAISINIGALDLGKQVMIVESEIIIYLGSTYGTLKFAKYYDSRTPDMVANLCASTNPISYKPICFVVFNNVIGLPIFNHYGASTSLPLDCNCSTPIGSSTACHLYNFLSGRALTRKKE
jgi:hypothetical protein